MKDILKYKYIIQQHLYNLTLKVLFKHSHYCHSKHCRINLQNNSKLVKSQTSELRTTTLAKMIRLMTSYFYTQVQKSKLHKTYMHEGCSSHSKQGDHHLPSSFQNHFTFVVLEVHGFHSGLRGRGLLLLSIHFWKKTGKRTWESGRPRHWDLNHTWKSGTFCVEFCISLVDFRVLLLQQGQRSIKVPFQRRVQFLEENDKWCSISPCCQSAYLGKEGQMHAAYHFTVIRARLGRFRVTVMSSVSVSVLD